MTDPVYTLIMITAVAVGAAMLRRSQRSLSLGPFDRVAIGVAAFTGAMLGAKVPFVLFGESTGAGHWLANGKTILTGLAGGYLAVEAAKRLLEITTKTGDTFAAPVAIAVAIGRLGCFRAGCCYGEPTTLAWGVVFPAVDPLPRHPTQLYESLFHLTMAALLVALRDRGWFERNLLKLYLIAYAAYRFASEFIRPESPYAFNLTAYQLTSLAMIVLFTWLWYRDAHEVKGRVPEPNVFES